jgi:serine/threonine protein kinase
MPDERSKSRDAVTTPVGVTTSCPQCGAVLDALTTSCGTCGAVITAGEGDGGRAARVRNKLQDAIGEAYVLGDMLGRGGMGIVFRAHEKALDRDVALKVLAFDPVLNPEASARFEREAKLAAKLDHPNIVPVFAVGQRNAIAFYTMRLVRGGSVEQLVTHGQGLDVPRAIGILRDVASALDYAHASGVVHRDIKPANILVGDSGHAMVADFGIARAFSGETSGTTATGTGVVGSPAYMSPEQWRGEKVDGRADQYALGVLAFELLSSCSRASGRSPIRRCRNSCACISRRTRRTSFRFARTCRRTSPTRSGARWRRIQRTGFRTRSRS